MIHVVSIDNRLEDDESFWKSLFRVLQSADTREPMMLVVGATRAVQNVAGISVDGLRTQVLDSTAGSQYEVSMRASAQSIVSRLTDIGIHSNVFLGSDRNILEILDSGRLRVNRLESIAKWCDLGVLPVVLSSGRNSGGEIVDMNPLLASCVITRQLNGAVENTSNVKACNLLLALHINRPLVESFKITEKVSLSRASEMIPGDPLPGCLPPDYCASRTGLSHVSRLGLMEMVMLDDGDDR